MSEQPFHLLPGTRVCNFVMADNFVDVISGPIGSGKTKGLCARIMRHIKQQRPSTADGLRKSRWAVVRNVYHDLDRSLIRTWLDLFPEEIYGRLNRARPPRHELAFADVRATIDFLALDKEDDVSKLRSVEYTGIAFNELSFIERVIFDEATSRVGRYPSKAEGGTAWRGVIADTNPPEEDHWLAIMTGKVDLPPGLLDEERAQWEWPKSWGFFEQPAAVLDDRNSRGELLGYRVNPAAENLHNLEDGYYERLVAGKSPAWIQSRLQNKVVVVAQGSPVWPMFRREYHVSTEPLNPVKGHDVLVWLDFGRVYPAVLFAQEVNQRILVQYEMLGFNEAATVFAPKVRRFLAQNYPGHAFRCVGDPKGQDRGQATEQSSFDVFRAHGMPVMPAPVKQNDISTRTEAVAYALNDNPSGVNRLVISPVCRTLIVGMAGRYHLVREEDGELRPKKDKYSNLCDCLQYGCLALGEGRRMSGLRPFGELHPVRVYRPKSMRRVVA
jgi:hypothetical protein